MPLSKHTAKRELIHKRHIECYGYRRDDGLWDIEGHLIDSKTYDFPNHDRGQIRAGEPVHQMWLRLTLDDEFVIRHAEAATDHGPYRICPDITDRFRQLEGIKIQAGWQARVNQCVGGINGCTHLRELLRPIATTAFQTIHPIRVRQEPQSSGPGQKPLLLGTCHAYAPESEVVKRLWPEYHRNDN